MISGAFEWTAAVSRDPCFRIEGSPTLAVGGGFAVLIAYGVDRYNQSVDEELAQPLRTSLGGERVYPQ